MKIGIIGYGLMGRLYREAFARVSGIEVTVVCARHSQRLDPEFAHTPRFVTDYRAVLSSDLDAVVVATPTVTHVEIARSAARAGKHILLEVPMGVNLDEARAIVEEARLAGIKLLVDLSYRYCPEHVEALRAVRDGRVGRILGLCDELVLPMPDRAMAVRYLESVGSGRGLTQLMGILAFDRWNWFLGSQPVGLQRILSSRFYSKDHDDWASLLVDYGNGLAGVATIGWAPYGFSSQRFRVFGERGVVEVRALEGYSLVEGIRRTDVTSCDPASKLTERFLMFLVPLVQEFVAWVREESLPRATAEDALAAHDVADRVYAHLRRVPFSL